MSEIIKNCHVLTGLTVGGFEYHNPKIPNVSQAKVIHNKRKRADAIFDFVGGMTVGFEICPEPASQYQI
ncbi:MAG: hypothetical protein II943_12785 [Victivallales bacterium]|nr:hypothetical protein [Victivallales bacterium]